MQSSSRKIKKALARLSERAEQNPDDAQLIQRALHALKLEMEDTMGIITCSEEMTSCSTTSQSNVPTVTFSAEKSNFDSELVNEFGLEKSLKLNDLRNFAAAMSAKHGIFSTLVERRSKEKLLIWLKTNREKMEPDFSEYLRKLSGNTHLPPLIHNSSVDN